ncbi:MAG: sigma-70 family RNA polymerase sigma factor [Actinomycetota bacterium]|nr:sigma-70 family RNA polymerase sigma factor [Actinomycetota bacterium]
MSLREVRPTDDDGLVARARNGDVGAFGELVREHQNEVYTLALRMVSDRDLAYDVTQDAFVRAWRAIDRFRGDARFSTWIHRITVNTAFTHRERRKRTRADSLDENFREPESEAISPERAGESAEMRPHLESALAALPDTLGTVVVLKDVYDWSHADVAAELGISVTAAKVRLHRARKQLRSSLRPHREEDR